MNEDFRGFLKEIEETKEGGFIRIKKEVDTRYEVAAIVTKLDKGLKIPQGMMERIRVERYIRKGS